MSLLLLCLFLFIGCSTCFGPPCAHLQELTTCSYLSDVLQSRGCVGSQIRLVACLSIGQTRATYKGEINIILKVTSSWSLYPHWTTMHGQPYIRTRTVRGQLRPAVWFRVNWGPAATYSRLCDSPSCTRRWQKPRFSVHSLRKLTSYDNQSTHKLYITTVLYYPATRFGLHGHLQDTAKMLGGGKAR